VGKRNNKFRERLAKLGLMKPWPAWFDVFLAHLKAYKEEHGDCKVPQLYKCTDGYTLGNRVGDIRRFRQGKSVRTVTPSMVPVLDQLGFLWEIPCWFDEFLRRLKDYKAEYGHCQVPTQYRCQDGYRLGPKVNAVRTGKRHKVGVQITPSRAEKLEQLGFLWDVPTEWFPEFLEHLKAYKAVHGRCQVRGTYVCDDGYKLGHHTAGVRNHRVLTPTMRSQLGALGFVWDATTKGQWWPEFLCHLREYMDAHGGQTPPQKYVCPGGWP